MIHLDYAYIVSSQYEFYVNHFLFSLFFDKKNGGEYEIRTRGSLHYTAFPRLHLKPLGQLSVTS